MEIRLHDGDYVRDTRGGFETVGGTEELLQRILFKLTLRRGSYPFLPELGSRLYLLPREKASQRLNAAYEYVSEAISDEGNISVEDIELEETGDKLGITIYFRSDDKIFNVSLKV